MYVNPNRTRTYTPSKDELEKIKSTLSRNTRKSFGDTLNKSRVITQVPEKEIAKKLTTVTQGNKLLNKGFKTGTRGMTKANLFTKLSRRMGTKTKVGLALAGAALAYQAFKPNKTKTKTPPTGGVPIPITSTPSKLLNAKASLGTKQTKLPLDQRSSTQNKVNRLVGGSALAKS